MAPNSATGKGEAEMNALRYLPWNISVARTVAPGGSLAGLSIALPLSFNPQALVFTHGQDLVDIRRRVAPCLIKVHQLAGVFGYGN